jgi:hypothetical protein
MTVNAYHSAPFRQHGANTTIAASTTSARGALARTADQTAVLTNPHATSTAFFAFGGAAIDATTAGFPVGPGRQSIVHVPYDATHVAVILNASTSNIHVSVGDGNHIQ